MYALSFFVCPLSIEPPGTAPLLEDGEYSYKFKCFGTWCTDTARQAFPDADGAGKHHRCVVQRSADASKDTGRGGGDEVAHAAAEAIADLRAENAQLRAEAAHLRAKVRTSIPFY